MSVFPNFFAHAEQEAFIQNSEKNIFKSLVLTMW